MIAYFGIGVALSAKAVLGLPLQMAFRVDTGSLRSPQRLDDGRVIVDGVLTRSGVFLYRNPDGSERREYRPAEEVFRADSMGSFAMVPVTDDHPTEMLTSRTARAHTVGTVGEKIRRDGHVMVAPLAIHDAATIEKLDAGKTALSCGYVCDLEETPGETPEGERYDVIQRNIRGNHVAIVEVGRAGPEARIRMDAAVQVSGAQDDSMKELTEALKKIAELEVSKAQAEARADKAEAERDSASERADKAEAERDAASERADKAEKARTDAAEGFDAKVAARVALQAQASKGLGENFDFSGKSDREIREAFIKEVTKFDCAGKSDAYVEARYDAAVEVLGEKGEIYNGLARVDADKLDSAGGSSEAKARAAMEERSRNAWKAGKDQ